MKSIKHYSKNKTMSICQRNGFGVIFAKGLNKNLIYYVIR